MLHLPLGDQGDVWHQGELSLPAEFTQVFLIAVRGSGTNSDIAVDDLLLTTAPCSGKCSSVGDSLGSWE